MRYKTGDTRQETQDRRHEIVDYDTQCRELSIFVFCFLTLVCCLVSPVSCLSKGGNHH